MIRTARRFRPVLICALAFAAGCGTDREASPAPPLRISLFDRMGDARFEDTPKPERSGAASRVLRFDFNADLPAGMTFGRAVGRRLVDGQGIGALDATGRREGGGLRLGPGVPEDMSRAVVMVPAEEWARVEITARVRLEGHPQAGAASSREVLRVVEQTTSAAVSLPTRLLRVDRSTRRVSRRIDPSGWDRIDDSFITRPGTKSLEIQLLHRSGGSDEAVTRFDDLAIEVTPLSPGELYEHLKKRYTPRDGRGSSTPWRLRVSLSSPDGRRSEVRDAVLLPPPAKLVWELRLPPADSRPVLRFQVGVTEEAHGGNGARIDVAFRTGEGNVATLGSVEINPRQKPEHREWRKARFDLSSVAGQKGELAFASVALPGEAGDAPNAVVLSTPRIEPAARAPEPFNNVLLIGVDTLRADRMSAFGYRRPTTPSLKRLADHGVRFPQTRSQAPWTLPSFASILTALYPSAHGAGRGGHEEWTGLDPQATTLAEILAGAGYETQAVTANSLISPRYGLDQGFEGYQSRWAMESAAIDKDTVAAFVDTHRSTPWLMFWHVMDPHLPYSTEASFRERFTEKGYDGRFARPRRAPVVPFEMLDPRPGSRWLAHEGPPPLPGLSDRDRRFVHDSYDAEVAEMDAAVGHVLDAVRESGQWDRTLIAFVADHGEGLGDHGHYHHGYTLFEDQVHVPMIVRIPGRHEGGVVERPVAAIDLAPTILGALGIDPPDSIQGVDRLAADAPADDAIFSEVPSYESSAQKAWVLGGFKYLHDPLVGTQALYDLKKDPGETTDVAADHPAIVARARREMDAFRWREVQKGRFHLRVVGRKGQRLNLKVDTDGFFDSNFVTRPIRPEGDFNLHLPRRHLELDTVLEEERLELVFWCRGHELDFEVTLDGQGVDLDVGASGQGVSGPQNVARDAIPELVGGTVAWPERTGAVLWLEAGGSGGDQPVVLTPEEIERLRALGYLR